MKINNTIIYDKAYIEVLYNKKIQIKDNTLIHSSKKLGSTAESNMYKPNLKKKLDPIN